MKSVVRDGTFFANPTEAVQLTSRIMSEKRKPGRADAAYLFAHTPENMRPIIEKGAQLYLNHDAKKLVILALAKKAMRLKDGKLVPDYGTPARMDSMVDVNTYPILIHAGWCEWWQELWANNIEGYDIICSGLPDPIYTAAAYNTHTEAVAFVKMAKDKGWGTVRLVSPAWHILRATAETVTAALNYYPELQIFPDPVEVYWEEATLQSQSDVEKKSRVESLVSEVAKLDIYYRWGDQDMMSAARILGYFQMRDDRWNADNARALEKFRTA